MCKEIEVLIKNYKTNYISKMRKGVNTPTKKKNIELRLGCGPELHLLQPPWVPLRGVGENMWRQRSQRKKWQKSQEVHGVVFLTRPHLPRLQACIRTYTQ